MQRIEQIRKEARNIQMALECMNNPNIEAMIERLDSWVFTTLAAVNC